ncbi:myoglobin-like [Physella acuta]|uniref:myoglobin-like n=1 Tax=Physella acuta TaxID=109671 RepID=UPI0027DDAC38|nr:myoglobin-like [Physella acuta]
MQPDVFFTEITLFLRGFNETCGLPEGMLYEGVTDRPRRIVINSAASQTTMFQIIDSLLRTTYPPGKENFFHVLRSTWSAKHRELFNKIKNWPGNLKDIVIQSSNPELTLAYNEVVESVKQFRNYHLQLVTKFTVIPNKRVRNEHNAEGPDPFAYLMPLLKGIRDESAKSVVES